jgi:hypothetical protein
MFYPRLTLSSSPGRLAESAPHTMSEDRAILESIFAENRHAILDLHGLDQARSHKHSSSNSSNSHNLKSAAGSDSTEDYAPGAHGRKLSAATGVEIPPVPDVLPTKSVSTTKPADDSLARRFSKRGARLGVHMSILDLGAHDTPVALRKKWLAQARSKDSTSEAIAQPMATIEEDGAQSNPNKDPEQGPSQRLSPPRTSSDESVSKARRRANSLITSPAGKAFSKVIHRLSLSTLRKSKEAKGKQPEETSGSTSGSGSGETDGIGGGGIKQRLNMHLIKPELSTPDYNKEFENGRL